MLEGQPTVKVCRLRKSYGERLVLDEIDFEVDAGEIVGLLGPNGAGKTTTLSILATLIRADAGEVRIAGCDSSREVGAIRQKIGFVPQSIALYPSLSAAQNVELFARIHRLGARQAREAASRALALVGLGDRAQDPVLTLSGGLQRRVNLACGMVHRPDILLLDEPTVGVDPQSRERIMETLRELANHGTAIIYSTHYMEEIERVCDRALLIDHGRLIASGTVAQLIALAGTRHRMEITLRGKAPTGLYSGMDGVEEVAFQISSDEAVLMLADIGRVGQVLDRTLSAGCSVLEFNLHSPNLSDAFMSLTGHALRDDVDRQ